MDNSQQTPALTPEQVQGLMASFQSQGQPQAAPTPPPPGPGDPSHDTFVAAATGQGAPQPPVMQRGRIGPSSNPILRLLGAVTGKGSFDYTNAPAAANQAGAAQFIQKLTGAPAPQSYSADANGNPVVTNEDLGGQTTAAGLGVQALMQKFAMQKDFMTPEQARAAYPGPATEKLISASPFGLVSRNDLTTAQATGKMDQDQTKFYQEQFDKLGDKIDTGKMRGGQMSATQGRLNAAERALGLVTQVEKQKGNADVRQLRELSTAAASMLMNGAVPAQEQIDQFMPNTLKGRFNTTKEFLANKPVGTDQQDFVARTKDTILREKQIAEKQIKQAQLQELQPYLSTVSRIHPEGVKKLLQDHGLNGYGLDHKGNLISPSGTVGVQPEPELAANRFADLMKMPGMTKAAAYTQLHQEGY